MSSQHRDSESNATEHAIRTWQMSSQHNDSESNATEHAITTWQEQRWRRSKECQHVIIVFVSLRSHRKSDVLESVLGQNLPALLNEATEQDGFFEVLKKGIISDGKLLDAVIDFLARWPSLRDASYQDLLADTAMCREAAALLPPTLPLWKWITGRLGGKLELCALVDSKSVPGLTLRRGRQIGLTLLGQIAEEDAGNLWIVLRAKSPLKRKVMQALVQSALPPELSSAWCSRVDHWPLGWWAQM